MKELRSKGKLQNNGEVFRFSRLDVSVDAHACMRRRYTSCSQVRKKRQGLCFHS